MSESDVSPILAALALFAVTVSTLVAVGVGAPAAQALRQAVLARGRWAAFAVAAFAMTASLYYSSIAHFTPCELCWFQRIAMYPLALLTLIAAITRDRRAAIYIVPLAVIGLGVSIYHYQLELFPGQASACSSGVPCSFRYVEEYGFVSIPFMAGCGFVSILMLHLAMYRAARGQSA